MTTCNEITCFTQYIISLDISRADKTIEISEKRFYLRLVQSCDHRFYLDFEDFWITVHMDLTNKLGISRSKIYSLFKVLVLVSGVGCVGALGAFSRISFVPLISL